MFGKNYGEHSEFHLSFFHCNQNIYGKLLKLKMNSFKWVFFQSKFGFRFVTRIRPIDYGTSIQKHRYRVVCRS